jgi:2-oxoglutarate ferredoxin oxidoreductase subunit beta
VNLKILLFNNQIYGLTKGQYSPTSPQGQTTKSTPFGSVDRPLSPLAVALGAGATFVARSVDVDISHLTSVLERAAHHEGTAFVEIYQDCNVFNSGAFEFATDKSTKNDHCIYLEHGKPLLFGKQNEKGVRLNGKGLPEIVDAASVANDDLLFHDEQTEDPSHAFRLAQMRWPTGPEPMGVFRAVQKPTFDAAVDQQIKNVESKLGPGNLDELFAGSETWMVM